MAIEISDSKDRPLDDNTIIALLSGKGPDEALYEEADRIRREIYGDAVYLRGLIEISNYCRNNCYYCGIRKGNTKLDRYRLDKDTILACCRDGYALGFRTFVLQGGEDPYYGDEPYGSTDGDERLCDIVSECGADFIKTSTGFSKGGATREDVKLMRERCPKTVKVKAAGGISSLQDAEDFLALGAERLGTSRIVKIAMEQSQE